MVFKYSLLSIFLLIFIDLAAQKTFLPQGMADHEYKMMDAYMESRNQLKDVN